MLPFLTQQCILHRVVILMELIMFRISAVYVNIKDNKGIKGIYESYRLLQIIIEEIMFLTSNLPFLESVLLFLVGNFTSHFK